MYAIIQTGGKQYRIEKGDLIEVELLEANEGDEIEFGNVLLLKDGDEAMLDTSQLTKCVVKGILRGSSKGKKLLGFKYKKRELSGRKRFGHRQHYSLVEITEISQKS